MIPESRAVRIVCENGWVDIYVTDVNRVDPPTVRLQRSRDDLRYTSNDIQLAVDETKRLIKELEGLRGF